MELDFEKPAPRAVHPISAAASVNAIPRTSVMISVIVPAYQETSVITEIVRRIHPVMQKLEVDYEILVIDDGSQDQTAARAREAGARVISHPYNIGMGAALKTGIRNAWGQILVMLDGDGQHAPEDIPRLLERLETHDLVIGARTRASDTKFHRDLANLLYNWLATYVTGRKIEDLTSGFRAIKAQTARRFVYLMPNTFSSATTLTLAIVRSGLSLTYVPITTARRVGKSKIKLFQDGIRFLLIILKITTFFSPLKIFVPVSLFMFVVGIGYGISRMILLQDRYGTTSSILIIISVVVFLIGLVSEQVAQLRFDRSEIPENMPPNERG